MNRQLTTMFFILITVFLFSCKGVNSAETKKQISGSEYAIITFNPNDKYPIFNNAKPTVLSEAEILEIEKIIGPKISETINNHNKGKKEPDIYFRQYIAAINATGEKEIFIHLFCRDFAGTNWKTEIIDITDGGDCVFSLKVNLVTTKIYDFRMNLES